MIGALDKPCTVMPARAGIRNGCGPDPDVRRGGGNYRGFHD